MWTCEAEARLGALSRAHPLHVCVNAYVHHVCTHTRSFTHMHIASTQTTEEVGASMSPFVEVAPGKRIQTQVLPLAPDTLSIRSLDWDRDRFDIEFG